MDKMRKVFSGKNILISIGVILFDLFVYLVLGMLLMNYDDFYDESKGEYWSLESMTFGQHRIKSMAYNKCNRHRIRDL